MSIHGTEKRSHNQCPSYCAEWAHHAEASSSQAAVASIPCCSVYGLGPVTFRVGDMSRTLSRVMLPSRKLVRGTLLQPKADSRSPQTAAAFMRKYGANRTSRPVSRVHLNDRTPQETSFRKDQVISIVKRPRNDGYYLVPSLCYC